MKTDAMIDSRHPTFSVSAKLRSPKADGIAWPENAGYNDHILEKGKTPLLNVQLLQQKHQKRPHNGHCMVIVADYELVLNPDKGVFC